MVLTTDEKINRFDFIKGIFIHWSLDNQNCWCVVIAVWKARRNISCIMVGWGKRPLRQRRIVVNLFHTICNRLKNLREMLLMYPKVILMSVKNWMFKRHKLLFLPPSQERLSIVWISVLCVTFLGCNFRFSYFALSTMLMHFLPLGLKAL